MNKGIPKKVLKQSRNCKHENTLRIGLGIFCTDCKIRVGFVSNKEGNQLITDALENDIKKG